MKMTLVAFFLLSGLAAPPSADLAKVKAEPNLEKRSDLAMKNADHSLDRARRAYQNGEDGQFKAALGELEESVRLVRASLEASGKNPRRSPKYFKRAELGMRRLLRRLETFRLELSVDERGPVEKLEELVHQEQEALLGAIMGKPRKN